MVSQGDFVAVISFGHPVERAAAQIGTKRAGILFLTDIENNGSNIGFLNQQGELQISTDLLQGAVIIIEAQIQIYRHQGEVQGGILLEHAEKIEQGGAILAAR